LTGGQGAWVAKIASSSGVEKLDRVGKRGRKSMVCQADTHRGWRQAELAGIRGDRVGGRQLDSALRSFSGASPVMGRGSVVASRPREAQVGVGFT
jgi:hypothetical protein